MTKKSKRIKSLKKRVKKLEKTVKYLVRNEIDNIFIKDEALNILEQYEIQIGVCPRIDLYIKNEVMNRFNLYNFNKGSYYYRLTKLGYIINDFELLKEFVYHVSKNDTFMRNYEKYIYNLINNINNGNLLHKLYDWCYQVDNIKMNTICIYIQEIILSKTGYLPQIIV